MRIKITADSTCDLSKELVEKYGVTIVPLYVVKDGRTFTDGVDITPEEIYEHVRAGGAICSTAAASVFDYEKFFTEQKKDCDAIIHLHISASMSACYQNACIAAGEMEGVYPVDAASLSTGIGLLVLEAAEMARKEGVTAQEVVAHLEIMKKKLNVSFLVERLDFLAKGGRCSGAAALGANVLHLRPCIEVKDGAMVVGKKYRGDYIKCMKKYIRERLEAQEVDTRRIFLTDSGEFTNEQKQEMVAEILSVHPFAEVLLTRAGCTISNHCGPRTMGILFFNK